MNTHIKTWMGTTIIIIIAITAGMFVWKVYEMNDVPVSVPQTIKIPKKGNIVCAQEVKACPDGSYVSRTGPNCEFAPCPDEIKNDEKITSNDTADWTTYRNEEYGFEFKYPKEWKYKLPELDSFVLYLISPETETKIKEVGEYPDADVEIFYFKSVACMELGCTNIAKNLFDNLQSYKNSGIIGEVKKININGINGYETVQLGMSTYYTLYLENNGGIYQIEFALREDKKELSDTESQILSTFKFIN